MGMESDIVKLTEENQTLKNKLKYEAHLNENLMNKLDDKEKFMKKEFK